MIDNQTPFTYAELQEIIAQNGREQREANPDTPNLVHYAPIDFLRDLNNWAREGDRKALRILARVLPAFPSAPKDAATGELVGLLPKIASHTQGIVTEQLLLNVIEAGWWGLSSPLVQIAEHTKGQTPPVVTEAVLIAHAVHSRDGRTSPAPFLRYLEEIEKFLPKIVTDAVWVACGTTKSDLAAEKSHAADRERQVAQFKSGTCARTYRQMLAKLEIGGQ